MDQSGGIQSDLAPLIAKHRRWLDHLGIRDRPWLIFGSAPEPTVTPEITASHLRIDINNAGCTAESLGLGQAALTIRARRKSWEEHTELNTRALLWIHEYPLMVLRALLLVKPHRHIGSTSRISRRHRDELVAQVASARLDGIGKLNKVTNGVVAVCYGLALGVPQIVIAGISLSKSGHSYDQLGRARRQADEDAYILRRLKDHPSVFTTEADLASSTGLKLWTPATMAVASRERKGLR